MATCSAEDVFSVDVDYSWDDLGTMAGCYQDSGVTNYDIPVFSRDGEYVDEVPLLYASDHFSSYKVSLTWTDLLQAASGAPRTT